MADFTDTIKLFDRFALDPSVIKNREEDHDKEKIFVDVPSSTGNKDDKRGNFRRSTRSTTNLENSGSIQRTVKPPTANIGQNGVDSTGKSGKEGVKSKETTAVETRRFSSLLSERTRRITSLFQKKLQDQYSIFCSYIDMERKAQEAVVKELKEGNERELRNLRERIRQLARENEKSQRMTQRLLREVWNVKKLNEKFQEQKEDTSLRQKATVVQYKQLKESYERLITDSDRLQARLKQSTHLVDSQAQKINQLKAMIVDIKNQNANLSQEKESLNAKVGELDSKLVSIQNTPVGTPTPSGRATPLDILQGFGEKKIASYGDGVSHAAYIVSVEQSTQTTVREPISEPTEESIIDEIVNQPSSTGRSMRLIAKEMATDTIDNLVTAIHTAMSVQAGCMIDVSCPLCLGPLDKCHVMNCGHSFCDECVSKWKDRQTLEATYVPECPECNAKIRVSDARPNHVVDCLATRVVLLSANMPPSIMELLDDFAQILKNAVSGRTRKISTPRRHSTYR
ncbi:hypothetical protein PCE1_003516 [Barthelona sp. PCE]